MSQQGLRRTAAAFPNATHILLNGVTRTATRGDVRRAVMAAGMKGVADVSILYQHFRPAGKALLTMSLPDYTRDAIRDAERLTMGDNHGITAEPTADPRFMPQRHRGVKGRADATNRGMLGSGPSAGFVSGKTVTLYGLPGKALKRDVSRMVQGFELAGTEETSVLQAPIPERKFSMYSRFVVLLASESEAERLVRKLHLTPYKGIESAPIVHAEIIH
ncbi:hypothetical protein B0H34DRAFT_693481 [Crassisporium funariophilum]|nr:hypothetical protein B0H34DRAFT_693481 [Crassisporium funariophilum]